MIASRGGARLVVLSLALVIGCNGAPESSPEPSSTGASSPSPSPSPTLEPSTPQASEPSAVPSAATSREPLASLSAWRPVTDAVLGQASQVYPPAWSGQRFVVAGIQDSKVAFWTSPSGDGWATTDERTYGYTSEFAFEPSGVAVAVGWLNLGEPPGPPRTGSDGPRCRTRRRSGPRTARSPCACSMSPTVRPGTSRSATSQPRSIRGGRCSPRRTERTGPVIRRTRSAEHHCSGSRR